MVNINAFIAALKTTWLRKINTDNNSPWSITLQFITNTKSVFNLGTHFLTEKIPPKIKKNKFYRDVFSSYIQIVTKTHQQRYNNSKPFQFSPMKTSK